MSFHSVDLGGIGEKVENTFKTYPLPSKSVAAPGVCARSATMFE